MKSFSVNLEEDTQKEKARAERALKDRLASEGLNLADYRFVLLRAWNAIEGLPVLRLDAYPKEHRLARIPEAHAYQPT